MRRAGFPPARPPDESSPPVVAFLRAFSFSNQLASKPRLCKSPIAFDRGVGYTQHFSGFFDRQTAEVAQFYDSGMLWISVGELFQSVFEFQKLYFRGLRESVCLAQ